MIYTVGVYRDKKDDILIIPTSRDEYGIGINLNNPIVINPSHDPSNLGKMLNEGFEYCKKTPFLHSKDAVDVHEIVTGIKSYAKFSKDRLYLNVALDLKRGYFFYPGKRVKGGGYTFGKIVIEEPLKATDQQLGETLLKAFESSGN
jgi:hypothetical protein